MEQTDENNVLNASQLVKILNDEGIPAERKGIYADVDTLIEAGVDIVRTPQGYYIGSRLFEMPELKLLADAVGASKFISDKKSKELLQKLESLTSASLAKQLSRQVVVPDRVKTDNDKIFYTIDTIYQCIEDNRQMIFQYEQWNIDKTKSLRHDGEKYQVSPSFLLRNDENYYLVAFDEKSGEIRHYRVDKIVKAVESELVRGGIEQRENLNVEEYAKKHISMFAGEESFVTIKCNKGLVGVLLDKFGTEIAIRQEDEENIRARISVAVSPQFFGWLTGVKATIIAPENAMEAYRKYLNDILSM